MENKMAVCEKTIPLHQCVSIVKCLVQSFFSKENNEVDLSDIPLSVDEILKMFPKGHTLQLTGLNVILKSDSKTTEDELESLIYILRYVKTLVIENHVEDERW